jgi:D-Ala-D-Ala carboxypeptidase 3 (S13) family
LAIVADVLESFGIARGTYTLADGSGLSRLNRLSVAQLVTVLMRMAQEFRVQRENMAWHRPPDAERRQSPRFQPSDFRQRAASRRDSSMMSVRWRGMSTGLLAS